MNKHIIVIGGGTAGMETAGQLAAFGYSVSLIEKEEQLGGHIRDWYKLFPDRRNSTEVRKYLERKLSDKDIRVYTGTMIINLKRDKKELLLSSNSGDEFRADAVVISTGFDLFNCSRKEEYGYGIYDNVISSADLEAMFRKGRIFLHDEKIPRSIGFVHCVGSRDEKAGNLYCSKLCCVTAVKQAIEIREHLPGSKVFCFYMDMRMGGAHYEELYREAQEVWGVNFIRGKISEASETIDGRLVIKAEDTLAGRPLKIELDMLVLMAGMEMSGGGMKLAENSGLDTGENRFFSPVDNHYANNLSRMEGVFYAGTCTAPMNVTETISHARAAASEVISYLNGKKE